MADVSDLEQKINQLKFELSVLGAGNPDADKKQRQISQLQQQLAFEKIRQGSNS